MIPVYITVEIVYVSSYVIYDIPIYQQILLFLVHYRIEKCDVSSSRPELSMLRQTYDNNGGNLVDFPFSPMDSLRRKSPDRIPSFGGIPISQSFSTLGSLLASIPKTQRRP